MIEEEAINKFEIKNIIKIFIKLIFILKILVFTYGCSSESVSFMRGFLEEYNNQKSR